MAERKLAIMSERALSCNQNLFFSRSRLTKEERERDLIDSDDLTIGSVLILKREKRRSGSDGGQQEGGHHKLHKEIRQNTSLIKGSRLAASRDERGRKMSRCAGV